jgi:methyltransferase (TIGR00027 family)
MLLRMERLLLPGIITHYLARKRQIGRAVEAAIAGGCTRVVILGAGYDCLAYLLHRKHPDVEFIELDHPATQERKKGALEVARNLSFLPIDLMSEMPSAIIQEAGGPTVFVFEGLTMYLPAAKVTALLRDITALSGTGGTSIFTFMERREDGDIGFRGESRFIARWLSARSEPFVWGIDRRELPDFLRDSGLQVEEIFDHDDLHRNHLAPNGTQHLPLAKGELICIASPIQSMSEETDCNDKHSKLNRTRVAGVIRPKSEDEVIAAILKAESEGMAVSVCGARHAMGGQQFGAGTLLLDVSGLVELHPVDTERGMVEAGAGLMWPQLIDGLLAQQEDRETVWSICQKQTGADDLTLGGSLAANIHGRGLQMQPIIGDIEAFTLIDWNGKRLRCSRNENREFFSLAIGGYGCFGVITSVLLRLTPRRKLERLVEIIAVERVIPTLEKLADEGCVFGDFQFSIDERSPDFLKLGVLSCYRPVDPSREMPTVRKDLGTDDWRRMIRLAHEDRTAVFKAYSDFYLCTHGSLYWSDTHQLSVYLDDYHTELDRDSCAAVPASEMISELYVPRESLAGFMAAAADRLRNGSVPVIYGTVRLIEKDTESHLAWAREDFACIIFNLHTEHDEVGIARSSDAFRALIDIALSFGGSYFLTYHRWARKEQVERAYPQFLEFLGKKERNDPARRFQSDWWSHYDKLFRP